ncbi:MAG: hypothetical protein U1F98_03740 [Verrucomicrobiota bacterium]
MDDENRNEVEFDISHLLEDWDHQPGQVVVRKFTGADGREKIQLRVDLGILQMNMEGRPDGKRPYGHDSLFDAFQSRLYAHLASKPPGGKRFELNAEDCARLQLEILQYHHRYICLLQMSDYPRVIRDAERNLEVFEFVGKYASEEAAWPLKQFFPQAVMILTRARAMQSMEDRDYPNAFRLVEEGMDRIREFFREHSRADLMEQCGELQSLEAWLGEIRSSRPLSNRERIEQALSEAIEEENYEKAAQMRDALRNLDPGL